MKLYAYKPGSKSAGILAEALDIFMLRHTGPVVLKQKIINWGSSDIKRGFKDCQILNHPAAVAKATNKITTLRHLSVANVSVPEWDVYPEAAIHWVNEGATAVVRHKLTGHSGEGIEIVAAEDGQPFGMPVAPLYTKYIPKKEEYRLHVMHGEVFFIQRKARKLDVPNEEVNWKVRNLKGGFIYANKNVEVDDAAKREAIAAIIALGLDFGAVDIILGKDGKFYVLEVNTACGLEGTTLEKYVEQFKRYGI